MLGKDCVKLMTIMIVIIIIIIQVIITYVINIYFHAYFLVKLNHYILLYILMR